MILKVSANGRCLLYQIKTGLAQLVEHWSPKPGVGSSSLSTRAGALPKAVKKIIGHDKLYQRII